MHLVNGNTQLAQIFKAITKSKKSDLTPYPLTSQSKTIRMTKSLWKPQRKKNWNPILKSSEPKMHNSEKERCKVISKLSENRFVYSNYRNSIKITHNNILNHLICSSCACSSVFLSFSLKPIQFHLNVTNLTQLTSKPLFPFILCLFFSLLPMYCFVCSFVPFFSEILWQIHMSHFLHAF